MSKQESRGVVNGNQLRSYLLRRMDSLRITRNAVFGDDKLEPGAMDNLKGQVHAFEEVLLWLDQQPSMQGEVIPEVQEVVSQAELDGMPKRERKVGTKLVKVEHDGMYMTPDGRIYKVQIAHHGSGHLYAKKLVVESDAVRNEDGTIVHPARISFQYERGAINRLSADWRMSLEEAKEFGALYGRCVRCGKILTREESIERAMGPVCVRKL
jgi:hypothetical protein